METKQITGKVLKVTPKISGGGKDWYLFELEDNATSFSGFGKPEFKVGDDIEFEYTVTVKDDGKVYNNFKHFLKDKEQPMEEQKKVEARKIDTTMNKDYVLMLAAVQLCIERSKKNPIFLSDKEIYACYENMSNYLKNGLPRETTPESS